jgi:hypothetical protein
MDCARINQRQRTKPVRSTRTSARCACRSAASSHSRGSRMPWSSRMARRAAARTCGLQTSSTSTSRLTSPRQASMKNRPSMAAKRISKKRSRTCSGSISQKSSGSSRPASRRRWGKTSTGSLRPSCRNETRRHRHYSGAYPELQREPHRGILGSHPGCYRPFRKDPPENTTGSMSSSRTSARPTSGRSNGSSP